jgi:hypothetical protein
MRVNIPRNMQCGAESPPRRRRACQSAKPRLLQQSLFALFALILLGASHSAAQEVKGSVASAAASRPKVAVGASTATHDSSKPSESIAAAPVVFEPKPRSIVSGRYPQIGLRASGELFLTRTDGGNLFLHTSHDGGDSFDEGVRVNDAEGEVSAQAEASPLLIVRGMREFYVLWQSRVEGATKLRFARSVDWGKSFSKAIDVDVSGAGPQSFFTLSVSPEGVVYVVWLGGSGGGHSHSGQSAVHLARSTGHGASFEKPVRVSVDDHAGVCPCCRPSIAFGAGGAVHVSWRAVFDGNIRDFVVATSADSGQTWGAAVRVAEDNWSINGCPHSGSSMATLGGRLYVSWYTVSEGESQIYIAQSDNGGRSFTNRRSLSQSLLDPNHPALFEAGGKIAALFQGRDPGENNGWGKIAAYYREIDATGQLSPLMRVGQLAGSASYPSLAWEPPGRLFVVWAESSSDGAAVVLSRGRRTATAVNPSSPLAEGRHAN